MSGKKYSSVHYSNYLQLEKLLDSQHLRSAELGEPAHDEMLFIIIHQSYELWFKQIIHELTSIMDMLSSDVFDEKDVGRAFLRLKRIVEIQKLLIDKIKILETLTPLDFLEFRNYLIPASGFQSFQFRVAEVAMGLKPEMRTSYNNKVYSKEFTPEQQEYLHKLENGASLFDLLEKWLERLPFLENNENWDFVNEYLSAVENMTKSEEKAIYETDYIDDKAKELRIKMLHQNKNYIDASLNEAEHQKLIESGEAKLSYKATVALLMINLYRDEPLLRMPYNMLNMITEMDEQFTLYRYRHAQMVMRILGRKMGTGGSSGYEYLMKTVMDHQIFKDFHNASTLMISRNELPELPQAIIHDLGFVFSSK
jgi:tryptophan 2,3-dioxygenase